MFQLNRTAIELWCISDLLEHLADTSDFQSSSERKAERLPIIVADGTPDLTVAIGTAARGDVLSSNGCVVVGTRVFMHNSHPNGTNPHSHWTGGPFETVVSSRVTSEFFDKITRVESNLSRPVTSRFLVSPLNPGSAPEILSDFDAVALSNVNVTSSAEYGTTDTATVTAFNNLKTQYPIGSLETTHGLIRALCGDAFIFISGIANRIGHFGDEVAPRLYAQNLAAAHNAGVVLAWMLPVIDAAF